MTRIGKVEERRNKCPKKRHYNLNAKTGPKKDNLKDGFKEHVNVAPKEIAQSMFIPKIS